MNKQIFRIEGCKRISVGFPVGSDSKESAGDVGDQVRSLGWEDPLEKEWQPTAVLSPGESHGHRSLVGHSLRDHKELDTTEQLTRSQENIQLFPAMASVHRQMGCRERLCEEQGFVLLLFLFSSIQRGTERVSVRQREERMDGDRDIERGEGGKK